MRVVPERQAKQAENNNSHISTLKSSVTHETCGSRFFDAAGEKWIVLVDRYSGYAWTDKLKDTSTATVTAKLNSWFTEYGYPEYIRTDGGPQFRRDFKAYCDKALHTSRAKLAVQTRVERPSRSSGEKYEKSHPTLC